MAAKRIGKMGNIIEKVIVIKPFLSLNEGIVLTFNFSNGRYEFSSRDEDSSLNHSSACQTLISIEPWLVRDNMGEYFVDADQPEEQGLIQRIIILTVSMKQLRN